MESNLKELVLKALGELYGVSDVPFVIEHPKDLAHGDYATNVAMAAAKALSQSPQEIAQALVGYLNEKKDKYIESFSLAGPGFININLSRAYFSREVGNALAPTYGNNALWAGKRVMVEYTQPNPFKPFHIGHLMTNTIGESVTRIIDASGGSIIRANYQGDVGLHVAKAIYMLLKKGKKEDGSVNEQAKYIGECYAEGNTAYESDESAKKEIDEINKKVYERSDEKINDLYDWGRALTLDAFEDIYKTLGTKFDYYFFESEMAPKGKDIVQTYLEKGVFEESDGAVVFHAEKYDPKLHTRVFITKQGLPTYEAKELGLTMTKFEKERLDTSIVVTALEQKDYQLVVTEAIRQIDQSIADRMKVVVHGMMRFASGKMSSRKGNVITGESLIEDTRELVLEKMKEREMEDQERSAIANKVAVSAIKYSILRQGAGGNIIYDEAQSISFEGDSGPYLQYAATRAGSVVAKARGLGIVPSVAVAPKEAYEIEKVLYRFPEVVSRAALDLEPHHIVTYLTDLASRFNSFYANEVIADPNDEFASYKLALTIAVQVTLVRGLSLLGIESPERM